MSGKPKFLRKIYQNKEGDVSINCKRKEYSVGMLKFLNYIPITRIDLTTIAKHNSDTGSKPNY